MITVYDTSLTFSFTYMSLKLGNNQEINRVYFSKDLSEKALINLANPV